MNILWNFRQNWNWQTEEGNKAKINVEKKKDFSEHDTVANGVDPGRNIKNLQQKRKTKQTSQKQFEIFASHPST